MKFWAGLLAILLSASAHAGLKAVASTPGGGGGSGTVTSVAISLPSVFTVAGSPCTVACSLSATFATGQTANEVLATPNGSTGAVALRTLVTADLPAAARESTLTFYSSQVTSISHGFTGIVKFIYASTVDNIVAGATSFTCSVNPVVALIECGTSATCASPTTIGSATVTAANSFVVGTVSNPAITAGDFVSWQLTTGTCTALQIGGTVQYHSN